MVPVATLNGVWTDRIDVPREVVASLLADVADRQIPHCLQVRPACEPSLADLASEKGMVSGEEIPLMILETLRSVEHDDPAELVIRRLGPDEVQQHARVAAAGFEAPEELFSRLMVPSIASLSGVSCYLGEVEGVAVTTALGVIRDNAVGIFNVATPPAWRRRGYGAALTIRAVRDGFDEGAQWAWLQSSAAGYRVYERLGFRMLESWQCWLKP